MTDETGEAIDARARVVARARSYLGPQSPDTFWRVVAPALAGGDPHKLAWCGGFALACLVLEGLWPDDAPRWEMGKGFVLRGVSDGRLRVVPVPSPGDVAVFGAPLWHHAIVERFEGGKVYTIDGNTMAFPREGVTERVRATDVHTVFYSIAPLISEPERRA